MNNNIKRLHNIMLRHVVTIKITVGPEDILFYDGTVLSSKQNCLYLIASSEIRNRIDTNLIQVELPNSNLITLERNDFDMAPQDSGVIGIRCRNPRPQNEFGFEDLHPINICEDAVIELQDVYTYSSNVKLLTPGNIMLVENASFDHNCSRYLNTHNGAPTVNIDGHLVGFCFSHRGYLTSYNIRELAAKIERNQRRQFTRISDTFQHLRQQCRAIDCSLRLENSSRVVSVKIQQIGQPVDAASWKNLEQFRQQHPGFRVGVEIEQRIQQALSRMTGRHYVRDTERRVFFR